MDDTRVHWGDRFVVLHQDPAVKHPFKLGLTNEAGWAAYFNKHSVFVKRFPFVRGEAYPDFGANYESYTTDFMLEMETLSPLHALEPGESVEHVESWQVIPDVSYPGDFENDIASVLTDWCHIDMSQMEEELRSDRRNSKSRNTVWIPARSAALLLSGTGSLWSVPCWSVAGLLWALCLLPWCWLDCLHDEPPVRSAITVQGLPTRGAWPVQWSV